MRLPLNLPVGTRSLLFGVHQFALHPLIVALAWWHLYGFPADPRLWVAFIVHDWGYWGLSAMDDEAGERHVELGARIMSFLFGPEWGKFALYHSRFYARRDGATFSRLCVADKYSLVITPRPVYILQGLLSGELWEYIARNQSASDKYAAEPRFGTMEHDLRSRSLVAFVRGLQTYVHLWVLVHKHGLPDTWTPSRQT